MQKSSNNSVTWRHRFVSMIYATHNQSPQIKRALATCFAHLKESDIGLNVGAGFTKLHTRVINLDMAPGAAIDCCARAEALPFAASTFAVVLTQEVLEHVPQPLDAMREMSRVLKPDGILYCQLPFTIGYHPGPTDFWRFSKEGIRELVEQAGLSCQEVEIAVGPATGFYRIVVEFHAITLSRFLPRLYHPIKGIVALLFSPVKWLDPILIKSTQADRIAGGYYVIARKNDVQSSSKTNHLSIPSQ